MNHRSSRINSIKINEREYESCCRKNWLYKMKDLFQVISKTPGEILSSQLGHAKFLSLPAFAVWRTKPKYSLKLIMLLLMLIL